MGGEGVRMHTRISVRDYRTLLEMHSMHTRFPVKLSARPSGFFRASFLANVFLAIPNHTPLMPSWQPLKDFQSALVWARNGYKRTKKFLHGRAESFYRK